MVETIPYKTAAPDFGSLSVAHRLQAATPAHDQPVEQLGELIFLKAGDPLYHEEEAATCLYKVTSGAVRAFTFTEDGRRQINGFHFEGDFFGSAQFGHYRSSTEAITDCSLVRYRRVNRQAGKAAGQDALALEVALSEIRAADQQILLLGRMSACAKVAAFFLYIAERLEHEADPGTTVTLPMTRYDIADFLGLTPESVSRAITKLRQKGRIEMDASDRITLVDPDALTDIPRGF